MAVLYHFVQAGLDKKANMQQRVYALHAAGLYFLLLEIPGELRDVPPYGWIKHDSLLAGGIWVVIPLENVTADCRT